MPRAGVASRQYEGQPPDEAARAAAGPDETALVAGVAAGRPGDFRVLVDRHLSGVTALARRMLRDDAEAEDVAQEAFLRLWRSGSSLEIGASGVKPWLRRVVSNLCIDRIRSGARQVVTDEVPEQAEDPKQLRRLESKALGERVDRALKTLPERQRLALTLFHYEGMSQAEVAAEMSITDEAVESLLARARRALKAELKDEWAALKSGG